MTRCRATVNSQPRTDPSIPSNRSVFRQARMMVSWTMSSASPWSPGILSAYETRLSRCSLMMVLSRSDRDIAVRGAATGF
ncbi:hypothetical protein GCM10022295_88190 [Streptomyces osmaniensis]|uniref:Uncharacterized protein n=1 Tax=Streptomyces osmaniensis TaxID=593134 RepID=A0ABP6YXA0_9ACTN